MNVSNVVDLRFGMRHRRISQAPHILCDPALDLVSRFLGYMELVSTPDANSCEANWWEIISRLIIAPPNQVQRGSESRR